MILTYAQQENAEDWYFPVTDTYIVMRLECHEKNVEGEFRHLYARESQTFNSISEFIYKLELMLEQIKVPQATTRCRKGWGDSRKCRYGDDKDAPEKQWEFYEDPLMINGNTGLFFLIHIRYRCNSSWQGEIRWLKKNYTMMFRSVLELLMVLESTLCQQRILGL